LHILSPDICAPFDKDRKDLISVRALHFLSWKKKKIFITVKLYAQLTGYGNANDAFHPSSIPNREMVLIFLWNRH